MKQWEQALENMAEIQAKQAPAPPGRYGLSQNLTHPASLTHPAALNSPSALTHYTAGLGLNDIGLIQEPAPVAPPQPAVDIEPER